MKRQVRSVLLGLPVVAMLAVTSATPALADSRHRHGGGFAHHEPFWYDDPFEDHPFKEHRRHNGRSYHDRDHDDDIDLGGVAAIIGVLGALGVAGAMLSAPDPGGPIVWNDAPGYGYGMPGPLSPCQSIVRNGIAERFGTPSVQFDGGPDAGTAWAGGRSFNYRCTGPQVHVW